MVERNINTRISSFGNANTRQNEITADDLAIIRDYILQYDYGVLGEQSFNIAVSGSMVTVSAGTMFAYGYFGFIDNSFQLYLIPPSVPQYYIIYAELNRSVVPNTFKIRALNNQGSTEVNLRQDVLNSVRTGIFQLPLWRVRIYYTRTETASGITVTPTIDNITDLRDVKQCVKRASNAGNTKVVRKILERGVTAFTQNIEQKNNKIANVEFVVRAFRNQVNIVQ